MFEHQLMVRTLLNIPLLFYGIIYLLNLEKNANISIETIAKKSIDYI